MAGHSNRRGEAQAKYQLLGSGTSLSRPTKKHAIQVHYGREDSFVKLKNLKKYTIVQYYLNPSNGRELRVGHSDVG